MSFQSLPDASTTVKGKVQLAGDLGGTATSPTVVGAQASAITGTALAGTYRFNTQVITTNATQTGAIIKEGWSYITASSGTSQTLAITFPTAFPTSIIQMQIGFIGARTTSNPAAIGDFDVGIAGENVIVSAVSPTVTGFTASMYKSVAFAAGVRYGFWWRAVGT